jgi:L-ascorbate metabolism protein UlaG (beta-lactamase superfamily)
MKTPFPADAKVRIFRLYNDGYVVQTPSVTIGIDIIRGGNAEKPYVEAGSLRPLVEMCDVLFITHGHGDHADISVAKMFLEAGREVIAPGTLWKDIPSTLRVIRGGGGSLAMETIELSGKTARSLNVAAWPGTQGDTPNNVYAITTPEGTTIMHTGDQDWSSGIAPAFAAAGVKVDMLLVHCWMMPMKEVVDGIAPGLVICGHENEMGHTIDHREAWWLTMRRIKGIDIPFIVTAWGETISL